MTDLGRDFKGALDFSLSVHPDATSYLGLLETQQRQLSTRKGTYVLNKNWGIDLIDFIGSSTPVVVIANAIEIELVQDERALSVKANVSVIGLDEYTADVRTVTEAGPFDLVLSFSAAAGIVRIV